MVFPKARLAVSAGLFLAWIGFLLYLVARTRDPVILSRPQLDVATLVLVGDLQQETDGRPSASILITKIAWPATAENLKLTGARVTVQGLADCGSPNGWRGPGAYIVPLTRRDNAYEVTPLPLSPGYYPEFVTIDLVRVGPDKDMLAELAGNVLGVGGKKLELAPGILRRNVPRREAEEFKVKAETAKAAVRLVESESRIYQATHDALAQLDDMTTR